MTLALPILTKEELLEQLGKPIWGDNRLLSKLTYVSGISSFDKILINEKNIESTTGLNLIHCPQGLQIQLTRIFKTFSVGISSGQIFIVELDNKEQTIVKKEKSVIGRAAIGGLLLGPVGAIVGGMSGIGSKDVKSNADRALLKISVLIDGEESIIVFSCKLKNRLDVEKFLKTYYSEKLIS